MRLRWILILVGAFGPISGTYGKHLPSFAGPFYTTVRHVNNVSEEYAKSTGKMWTKLFFTHPKTQLQTQHIWGTFYSAIELTNQMTAEARISKWSNNQWKRNAFVLSFKNACSDLLKHAGFLVPIMYGSSAKSCPLPKMNRREIQNQTFSPNFTHFPVMPYGRYLFTLAYFVGRENVAVVVGDAQLDPKL